MTTIAPAISQLTKGWIGLRRRLAAGDKAEAVALVDRLLAESSSHGALHGMERLGPDATETNVVVVPLARRGSVCAVAKIAATPSPAARLQREASVLRSLAADDRLHELRSLVPALIFERDFAAGTCVVQTALTGTRGDRLLRAGRRAGLLTAAIDVAAVLHERSSVRVPFGPRQGDKWIWRPTEAVSDAVATYSGNELPRRLGKVARAAETVLLGRSLAVGRVHGDFWLGNLLFTRDGSRVTGIFDWDQAEEDGLPNLDVLHLLLYTRRLVARRELGDVVRSALRDPRWSAEERRLLDPSYADCLDLEFARAATVVYWLGHVAANLAQSSAYVRSRRWMRRNVLAVLDEAAAVRSLR